MWYCFIKNVDIKNKFYGNKSYFWGFNYSSFEQFDGFNCLCVHYNYYYLHYFNVTEI